MWNRQKLQGQARSDKKFPAFYDPIHRDMVFRRLKSASLYIGKHLNPCLQIPCLLDLSAEESPQTISEQKQSLPQGKFGTLNGYSFPTNPTN
jgi:hypothetical protein